MPKPVENGLAHSLRSRTQSIAVGNRQRRAAPTPPQRCALHPLAHRVRLLNLRSQRLYAHFLDFSTSSSSMALGSSEGWFSRLKNGLSRTRVNIVGLFSGGVVDEDFLEELEFALISADVGVETTTHILERLRSDIKLQGLKTQEEVKLALRDELVTILKPAEGVLNVDQAKPCVIMMCGVNGAGKTTSIGKLAKRFADNGKSVLLAAGDTFRAAAREQLAVWGERNRVEVIAQTGGDPAAVVFDAVNAGRARSMDVVIADTAGRLPTQTNLMEELSRIRRAQEKALEGARMR